MLSIIPLLPLIGFLINGTWYAFGQAGEGRKKAPAAVVGTLATLAIGASCVIAFVQFFTLMGMEGEHRVLEETVFSWMTIGKSLDIPMTLRLDPLSSLFTLVITGVGSLIHLFSIGYMGHDETPGKFFAYLNLFCFAMLMLVMGGSLPLTFLGWEGVGLCSYLLIGYWYSDIEKAKAGKKAFVVNRIGDFGFLIGMFLLYRYWGTLDFAALKTAVLAGHTADSFAITAICLFLFLACC